MLSRRGTRIKVLKSLYAASRDVSLNKNDLVRFYGRSVQSTFDLFMFCTYSLVKICRLAEEDGAKRKEKYLPSEEDKKFSAKLYKNPIIQGIEKSAYFLQTSDKLQFKNFASRDFARSVYNEFNKEEAYIEYLNSDAADHKEILLELFRLCRKSEYFNEKMDDAYSNWIDDKGLVVGAVKKVIKAFPTEENVFSNFLPDQEITLNFGQQLMVSTFEDDDELLSIIKPMLQNWDHERVAVIDMILIKMALVEFLSFETIPVKVTLNEYVDISKIYSTPKSKEFINGVLDKILKKLNKEGRIKKSGRGVV